MLRTKYEAHQLTYSGGVKTKNRILCSTAFWLCLAEGYTVGETKFVF